MPNPAPPQQAATRNGPIHKVPCPFCGGPNDFRDIQEGMAGQGFVDEGDKVICDHCQGEMLVKGVHRVVIVTVAQSRAPRRRAQTQGQGQVPAQRGLVGGLKKLLGK